MLAVAPVLVALLQPAGWNDCPYEIVDDPAPGACAAYVDTDNDGYCDHGQLPPGQRAGTAVVDASSSAAEAGVDGAAAVPTADAARDAGRRDAVRPRDVRAPASADAAAEAAGDAEQGITAPAGADAEADGTAATDAALPAEEDAPAFVPGEDVGTAAGPVDVATASAEPVVAPPPVAPTKPPVKRRPVGTRPYYLVWLLAGAVALYSLTRLLVALRKLRPSTHRRLWNVVVLLGFLGVAITGLLLVLRVSYGLVLPSPLEFLFWHVEAGIVFAIVGVIHLWWHWKYYWRMVRPARRDEGPDAAAPRAGEKEDR
jgi:hypothetical protein